MTDGYTYDPSSGMETHTDLIGVTKRLESSLNDLQVAVKQFTAANQGDSVANYDAAQAHWNQGQQEMNANMVSGASALGSIHDDYLRGDAQGASRFLA